MSKEKGLRVGCAAALLVGSVLVVGTAHARVSTERPGSILIFPKVTNLPGSQDTVIQISNTSNLTRHARCFYINGATLNGVPLWQITDFEIWLTKQQPTHWLASQGRPVNPGDNVAGLDPGAIPPIPPGFTGGLVCAQVDSSGVPEGGDSLKGEATLGAVNGASGSGVSKYNAVAVLAGTSGPDDAPLTANELLLDNDEYSGCPAGAHLNFTAEGEVDDVIEALGNGPSVVSTNLTFIPCSMDFERLLASRVTLSILAVDEMEGQLSTTTTVDCWRQLTLDEIGSGILEAVNYETAHGYVQILSTDDPGVTPDGVLGVANVLRADANGNTATAATNLHFLGNTDSTNLDAGVINLSGE